MRAFGVLFALAGAVLGAVGLLWAVLAVVGREWDYCPSGTCYPGELVGGAIALAGVGALMLGVRIFRTR